MFKKLLGLSDKTSGLLPKIEKVARIIGFLVLALDTLRFFKMGLETLENNETTTKAKDAPNSAGGGDGGSTSLTQESERLSIL